jgi:hypothetical protein
VNGGFSCVTIKCLEDESESNFLATQVHQKSGYLQRYLQRYLQETLLEAEFMDENGSFLPSPAQWPRIHEILETLGRVSTVGVEGVGESLGLREMAPVTGKCQRGEETLYQSPKR